jgi:hypothetical protein
MAHREMSPNFEVLTVEEDGSVEEYNETVSYRRLRDGGVVGVVGVADAADAVAVSNLAPGRRFRMPSIRMRRKSFIDC